MHVDPAKIQDHRSAFSRRSSPAKNNKSSNQHEHNLAGPAASSYACYPTHTKNLRIQHLYEYEGGSYGFSGVCSVPNPNARTWKCCTTRMVARQRNCDDARDLPAAIYSSVIFS